MAQKTIINVIPVASPGSDLKIQIRQKEYNGISNFFNKISSPSFRKTDENVPLLLRTKDGDKTNVTKVFANKSTIDSIQNKAREKVLENGREKIIDKVAKNKSNLNRQEIEAFFDQLKAPDILDDGKKPQILAGLGSFLGNEVKEQIYDEAVDVLKKNVKDLPLGRIALYSDKTIIGKGELWVGSVLERRPNSEKYDSFHYRILVDASKTEKAQTEEAVVSKSNAACLGTPQVNRSTDIHGGMG